MRIKTTWHFEEEKQPCGEAGKATLLSGGYGRSCNLPDTIKIIRVATHPWFLIFWEELKIDTPKHSKVQPWCCYIRTIIFYHKPWKEDKEKRAYVDYGKVEHFLHCDDLIKYEGELFDMGTGRVVSFEGKWYFVSWARRQKLIENNVA